MSDSLLDVAGIGPDTARRLAESGFTTVDSIANADPEALTGVSGIGPSRATALPAAARRVLMSPEQPPSSPAAGDHTGTAERKARKLRKKARRLRTEADALEKKAKATKSKKKRKRRRNQAAELRSAAKKLRRKAEKLAGS